MQHRHKRYVATGSKSVQNGWIQMTGSSISKTPKPPYYAVIFTSKRSSADAAGYDVTAARMIELASQQPGFLGVESVRGADGLGITVSYWASLESVAAWKAHAEHKLAQEMGKQVWYEQYELRIAKVERAYGEHA